MPAPSLNLARAASTVRRSAGLATLALLLGCTPAGGGPGGKPDSGAAPGDGSALGDRINPPFADAVVGTGGTGGTGTTPDASGAGGSTPLDAPLDTPAGGDAAAADGSPGDDSAGGAADGAGADGRDAPAAADGASATDSRVDGGIAPVDAASSDAPSGPGAVKVFDQIPQFGMYATGDPKNYTPPAGVLMWNYGSFFVTRLTEAQQARIGADVVARLTYHAQCDNYDRLATAFFITLPKGQAPKTADPRVELVRFITPFSNHTRGALATRVYPDVDVSTYARALADTTHDVWIGIGGGSNPYDGDPCTNANVTPEFRAIGYKFSMELVSTKPLPSGGPATVTLPGIYYVAATKVPVTATFDNPGAELVGRVTVIVSGHGSAAGGVEYQHTQDTVSVNGQQVGTFATQVDCAPFASLSPDGNQGIFRNNTTTANPRNWCPGAAVAPRSFAATFPTGRNMVSLGISPADVPSGSYYSTSITFTAP